MFSLVLVAIFLAAAGCTLTMPKQNTAPDLARPSFPNAEYLQATNEAEVLIHYAIYLRRLNSAELSREHETMRQNVIKSKTELNRAQLAMFYALPGLPQRDDARALSILDPLGKEAASPVVRNFVFLLLSLVADNKRLDDSLQNLNSKLREEQKQSAEFQQKLEALKSIEKSLSDRGKASAPRK